MIDYATMCDSELGEEVAEKVLGLEKVAAGWVVQHSYLDEGFYDGVQFLSWWGAGLVIDTLLDQGFQFKTNLDPEFGAQAKFERPVAQGGASDWSPIRAILIAALKATEARA